MMNKKLIKGVIYDDKDILVDAMVNTLGNLNYLVSDPRGIDKVNECMRHFNTQVPSRDEFLTSVIIDTIVNPTVDQHNMIIPSTAVSEKLYNELSRIDIGAHLQDAFIDCTEAYHYDEYFNEDEEQGYEIVQSGPYGNVYRFHSKGDLLDFLKKGLENGNFTEDQYLKMMNDIDRLSA